MTNLFDEVLDLNICTSNKYVVEPDRRQIQSDLLIGLRRFKNTLRWKEYWRIKKMKEKANSEAKDTTEESQPKTEEDNFSAKLRPKNKITQAPKGTEFLEGFLKTLENDLLTRVFDDNQITKQTKKDKEITRLLREFRDTEDVIVPTDNTNSIRIIKKEKYIEIVLKHLSDSASQIPREILVEIHDASNAYLAIIAICLPKNVRNYIQEALNSIAVPSPKALIKGHKDPDENGSFPSRLVILATNFTAPFAKVGYLGIKGILDKNKIIYDKFTIQNAHDLKKVLETEKFRKDKNTAFALDIESMYPSIKFKLVRASILYFTRKIPKDKKKNLDLFI